MEKNAPQLEEIKLVGIQVRTSYHEELDKGSGKISPCVQKYFHQVLFEKIPNKKNPGTTICAYTDYESNYKGAYTYFIGEEVTSFDEPLPEGFQSLIIPKQTYAKFTTKPNTMPDILIDAWQAIWNMSDEDLGGKRRYHTDFELYDERAADHHNVVLDLYVGIED